MLHLGFERAEYFKFHSSSQRQLLKRMAILRRASTAHREGPRHFAHVHGSFAAPHGLAVDSKGDVYVSEVTWTFAVSRGRAPEDCHTFQKLTVAR